MSKILLRVVLILKVHDVYEAREVHVITFTLLEPFDIPVYIYVCVCVCVWSSNLSVVRSPGLTG